MPIRDKRGEAVTEQSVISGFGLTICYHDPVRRGRMKFRVASILLATGLIVLGLKVPAARSATSPSTSPSSLVTFVDGISAQHAASDLKMFVRQANGTYTSYEIPSFPPAMTQLVQAIAFLGSLVSGSGPGAPAGIGLQTQLACLSASDGGSIALAQY